MSQTVLDNFKANNDKWVTETVNGGTKIERMAGATFVQNPANVNSSVQVIEATLGAQIPANTQVQITNDQGQIIGVYDTTALVTYTYDGLGRMTKERRHFSEPQEPVWFQDFSNSSYAGLTALPTKYMRLSDNRLIVNSNSAAQWEWLGIWGDRTYSLVDNIVFRAEITTGSKVPGRYLLFGADGDWGLGTYRRHAAQFDGDSVFVSYYDTGYQTTYLGAIASNTAYIVEVASDEIGTTLYIYEKGTDRALGYVDRRNYSDWGSLRTFVEAQGYPNAPIANMYVQNLTESTSSSPMIVGVSAPLDSKDRVKEYFYDKENKLVGVQDASGAFITYSYDFGGRLKSQRLHSIPPQQVQWVNHFDANFGGFWDVPANYFSLRNGQLEVASQNSPYSTWVTMNGARENAQSQGLVFRAEVSTGSMVQGRYLVVGLESDGAQGAYRRHAAYFDGDSVFTAYYSTNFADQWLGLISNNTTYIVEIEVSASSSTLYIYPQGTSRNMGFRDTRYYNDWSVVKTFVEAHGAPSQANAKMYVDYMSEANIAGKVYGSYVVQDSVNDIVVPVP